MLGTDAQNLTYIEEEIDICTIDVTFTSLKTILPNVKNFLIKIGDIIALAKPLFEIEFQNKINFIIIQESQQLYQILVDLIEWSIKNHIFPYGIIRSPILGKEGSIEFFIHFKVDKSNSGFNYEEIIKNIL